MASIIEQVPFNLYDADGIATVYPYEFELLAQADLVVSLDGAVVPPSGYVVAGVGDQDGGAVTFSTPPAGKLLLERAIKLERDTDYQTLGDFRANTVDRDFNRIWMALQGQAAQIGSAIRLPLTEQVPPLPFAAARAGRLLAFNSPSGLPIVTDYTSEQVRNAIAAAYGGGGTLDALAFIQSGAGAVVRTAQDKARERISVRDYGAVGDSIVNDLARINAVIAAGVSSEVDVPPGVYRVTAAPANPMGVRLAAGPGKVMQDITIGGQPSTYRINSYTPDARLFFGSEYLYRAYARLQNFVSTSPLSTLLVRLFGDSTVAGMASHTAPYRLENLVPAILRSKGAPNVTAVNHGVAGSKVSAMNVGLIDDDTDLIFIKYGINDFLDGLTGFATNLRAKLAAIRATRGVNSLSIVLVAPSATYQAFGLTTSWYEDLRNVYVAAARDYSCAYFDTYALLQDVRQASGFWMDGTIGGNETVHPENMGQSWIWGAVLDAVFPASSIVPTRSNVFTNDGAVAFPAGSPADLPFAYPMGYSLRRATVANGWPIDGLVETVRHVDQIVTQRLTGAQVNASPLVAARTNVGATDVWGGWSGVEHAASLQNGWGVFSPSYSSAGAVISADKRVLLKGVISGGTTAATTLIFTLPAGMRPAQIAICPVFLSSGAIGAIAIDAAGNVTAQTALDSTYTSLDGASFLAA
ncbi:GDSL-type esterase/lipase family protein [Pseudorhodoferax sp.]|uniref:SGNH/GDSL hydrolase family protein n=1 Tax=Pseudorhodoferax sp. TaxID=1993553 RepID=UPI0039E38879